MSVSVARVVSVAVAVPYHFKNIAHPTGVRFGRAGRFGSNKHSVSFVKIKAPAARGRAEAPALFFEL